MGGGVGAAHGPAHAPAPLVGRRPACMPCHAMRHVPPMPLLGWGMHRAHLAVHVPDN